MKILRVIPSMNPKNGGPCQGIRNSIPALDKLGSINDVVCFDDPESQFIKKDEFRTFALGNSKTGWVYNSALKYWLRDNMHNYDIIIVHGLWLYHSFIAIDVINKTRRAGKKTPKVYIMPHGMLDPWFQKDSTRKLKALRNEIYWKFVEKKTVNSSDGLLFTCEEELRLAKNVFKGYKPPLEINIGYGVQPPPQYIEDMSIEFSKKVPSLKNKPYLLYLSRIHPKKGIDLLIDAYLELERSNYNLPKLIIAGPEDSGYAKQMKIKASQSTNIYFTGMLQGNSKWGALYGCHAFILPSHQENFGIAVVEALSIGKPVLITDQVNIWKEIKNSNAGLVGTDNYHGVLNLLKSWIEMPLSDVQRMSISAKEVYMDNFSISNTAKKMFNFLRTCIVNQ